MTPPTHARTRIKICGITNHEDAQAAVDHGADAIGFIFVEDTPRYIDPQEAAAIMFELPPMVSAVGVVQVTDIDEFCTIEQICPAHTFQLHGKEPLELVKQCGPGVIKAFKYEEVTIQSQLNRWEKVEEIDALLLDGSDGGQGQSFDWTKLAPLIKDYPKKIIIAGGLDASNVGEVIQTLRPYAIDVSTGVESEPGIKDHTKIAALCAAVRAADASN
ncbi:MAG: phosphoribosylanthranilate isomerase [Phycisphaerales bacterium]|nr:phosphoribosylanthranilate isomerase [Phycisphaerales bacterium]